RASLVADLGIDGRGQAHDAAPEQRIGQGADLGVADERDVEVVLLVVHQPELEIRSGLVCEDFVDEDLLVLAQRSHSVRISGGVRVLEVVAGWLKRSRHQVFLSGEDARTAPGRIAIPSCAAWSSVYL